MPEASPSAALNMLLLNASAVVMIAGLREAADIILPVMFSGFLAILCEPAVRVLVRVRVPRSLPCWS